LLGGLVVLQALVLLFNVVSFRAAGLQLVAPEVPAALTALAVLVGLWGYFFACPGRAATEWVLGETFLAITLFLTLGALLGPAQYGGAALNRPYVDGWLAAADAAMGINVGDLAAWTGQYPWLVTALTRAYYTLLPQFFLPFVLLGFVFRDRRALWEYVALLHAAAFVTVVCFALWPAACPPQFYGFDPVGIDQSRVFRHLAGLRSGTMTTITMGDLDGLVSAPSFHVLGAMCVTWAFRRRPWIVAALLAVNIPLAVATVVTGVHYAVDVVAAFVLFPCTVWIYRRVEHLIDPPPPRPSDVARA
jgi:membrane-associated phospholipid phosphatase